MRSEGCYMVGDDGVMTVGGWADPVRIIPESKMKAYKRPPQTIPRVRGHHRDWIDACKGGAPASAKRLPQHVAYRPIEPSAVVGGEAVGALRRVDSVKPDVSWTPPLKYAFWLYSSCVDQNRRVSKTPAAVSKVFANCRSIPVTSSTLSFSENEKTSLTAPFARRSTREPAGSNETPAASA